MGYVYPQESDNFVIRHRPLGGDVPEGRSANTTFGLNRTSSLASTITIPNMGSSGSVGSGSGSGGATRCGERDMELEE